MPCFTVAAGTEPYVNDFLKSKLSNFFFMLMLETESYLKLSGTTSAYFLCISFMADCQIRFYRHF